jgi:hypothetical protein
MKELTLKAEELIDTYLDKKRLLISREAFVVL